MRELTLEEYTMLCDELWDIPLKGEGIPTPKTGPAEAGAKINRSGD